MTSLAVTYRPTKLRDVVGQDAVVKSLQSIIKNRRSSSFLFSGPSGCGKTTLARIAADMFDCTGASVLEIDASTKTGVDDMRLVQDSLKYKSLSGSGGKAVIIDECHMLSKAAWNSLLKIVEEPPEHVYFFFCTTELGKVPKTIKTRCAAFTLKPIPETLLTKLVKKVMEDEGLRLNEEVLDLVVSEADGSARQALVNLSACVGVKDRADAATLLRSAIQSETVLELCRFLVNDSRSWPNVVDLIAKLDDEAPESVRIMVVNYVGVVLRKERNSRRAGRLLEILQEFSEPYNPSEKWAPLLLSVGRVIFS